VPDPRDDFAVLAEREHLMFGLPDPYDVIRAAVEAELAELAPAAVLDAIELHGDPKWLTIVRRDGDGRGTVVQLGFCAGARLAITTDYAHEQLAATLTFLVGDWDDPDRPHGRYRAHLDLDAGAEAGLDDEVFRRRFQEFRENAGVAPGDDLR
jgi:dienelactone hydrolase